MPCPCRAMAASAVALLACIGGSAWAADTLFSADFEDGDTSAWQISGAGDAQVTVYAGNHSLRLTRQETATTTVNTDGYATISITASFAAYRLGMHDACVAEWSLDDGKTWKSVTTVHPGQDDGISLRRGAASKIALNHAPHLLVRLRSQLSDPNAACWGDNVAVMAERG